MQTKSIYWQGRIYQGVPDETPFSMSGTELADFYTKHDKLPITIIGSHNFTDGTEVILGKDYEVNKNCSDLKCTDKERKDFNSNCCEAIALPLLAPTVPVITLDDLPKGSLFKYGETVALKTEYYTDKGAIEAYIVGSGEFFWGGTDNAIDQRKLIVCEIKL